VERRAHRSTAAGLFPSASCARLGAGDPATLSRHLNAIEADIVQAGLGGFAVPDVPAVIGNLNVVET
jgi:hypothetical protein